MPDDNVYAPPSAEIEQAQGPLGATAELAAFVGTRSDYYLERWGHHLSGVPGKSGFSLGAFFLGPIFFVYRKMYLYALLLVGALIFLTVFLVGLALAGVPEVLNHVLSFGFGLFVSFKAHDWYYHHASTQIAAAKQEGCEGLELLRVLRERGGTNLWLPLLLSFAFLTLSGLLVYLFLTAISG